jgi:hypothetical protein
MLHILALEGKNLLGNYAMQKSKFRFLHVIVADFRHPLRNFEGVYLNKYWRKKMFFCENSVEIRWFDGTSMKLKKAKLLTGLTCVLKDNYKYAQKQNLEVKQIFF